MLDQAKDCQPEGKHRGCPGSVRHFDSDPGEGAGQDEGKAAGSRRERHHESQWRSHLDHDDRQGLRGDRESIPVSDEQGFSLILLAQRPSQHGDWVIMKKRDPWGDHRFLILASLMLAFSLAITISRILLSDQPGTITILNDVAAVLSALTATVLFVMVWLSTSDEDVSKKIWGKMVLGMVAWTVAETTWAYYEVIRGEEVPYPSLADLFWLLGYVLFYLALLNQYRVFQTTPNRQQKITIALLVSVFTLAVTILVLKPIMDSFDQEKLLESLLNIAYPFSDLVLLILTLAILFSLEHGRFAFTWRLLGLGLVFMSLGDLIFSYASWNEIYYPESQLNTLTILIDTLYYIAYFTLGLGAYSYYMTSASRQPVKLDIVLQSLTKSNILVFIDADGRIISLSDNFANLVRSQSTGQYVKTRLSEALKIDRSLMMDFIKRTLAQGFLSNQPVDIREARGARGHIWLTSLPVYDDQKHLVCIGLVLRANLHLQDEEERALTEEQKMLVNYYLTQTGTYRYEENQVIKAYFLQQIRLLYSLVQQFNGVSVAEKLLTSLSHVAGQNQWHFTFTDQEIGIPEEYEGEVLADRLCILLQEARSFAVNMINLNVVRQELRILDNNISPDNLRYLDKYNLRGRRATL